jgi:hypothetical protein
MNLANIVPLLYKHMEVEIIENDNGNRIYKGRVGYMSLSEKDALRLIENITAIEYKIVIYVQYPHPYWT